LDVARYTDVYPRTAKDGKCLERGGSFEGKNSGNLKEKKVGMTLFGPGGLVWFGLLSPGEDEIHGQSLSVTLLVAGIGSRKRNKESTKKESPY